MILHTLELTPRGETGLGSRPLRFGRNTTLLLGPNGSGKTPLLKTISFCLGHPVELPRQVRERVHTARLTIIADGAQATIERVLDADGVEVTVRDSSGETQLSNEREFSAWILPKLGIKLRTLSNTTGAQVAPYMSVVSPIFLVDQDTGWTTSYVPLETHRFIRDQRDEVLRWILDLPPKNRPVDKAAYKDAQVAVEGLREQISFKRRALESMRREIGEDALPGAAQQLEERSTALEADLERIHTVLRNASSADSALDVHVREATSKRDVVAQHLSSAKRRKDQITQVQVEVGAELKALEDNERAAEAFRTLCTSENCQFFRRPEGSYGRSLLYLKDLLKDFDSTSGELERQSVVVAGQLANAEAFLQTLLDIKDARLGSRRAPEVTAMRTLTRELADVRVRVERVTQLEKAQLQLEALIDREIRAVENLKALEPTRGPSRETGRMLDARQHLEESFKEWLRTLHTPNVPASVVFDEDLRLVLDGERFAANSSQSGSTRTRIVLALHAAILETSLRIGGCHPRLVVLDAPRQQELDVRDLRAFVERFYSLSASPGGPVQLVFSASDPEVIPPSRIDAIWRPSFEIDGSPRFLGTPAML